jgi:hypothetical protein
LHSTGDCTRQWRKESSGKLDSAADKSPEKPTEKKSTNSKNNQPHFITAQHTEPLTGARRSLYALSSYEINLERTVDDDNAKAPQDSKRQEATAASQDNSGTKSGEESELTLSMDTPRSTKVPTSQARVPKAQSAKTPAAGVSESSSRTASKLLKPIRIDKDKEFDNEDSAECPGGGAGEQLLKLPDDIPLEEEPHPYDAPAAELTPSKPAGSLTTRAAGFTKDQLKLRSEINQCLSYYMQHPESIARRSPWAVMHAILPFGVEAELVSGNRKVSAIGWMCYNGVCKTQRIFQPTKTGFRTNLGPGVQGHEGQFLAILAQSGVAADYPIKISNRSYKVNDLVRYEMSTCREDSELTFKLIGLSYYLDQNQQWRDNRGITWSLDKIVAEELDQPIVGAACGGTHRLMGLTFSLMQHKQAGLPVDGHWYRAEQYLNDFVQYAFTLQNADGSFSTEWFEARGNDSKIERKIQTTGHILEWLVYTLPENQLESPQVQKSIRFLLNTIGAEPGRDWPIGPRGHSLQALALYNQRVFGAPAGNLKKHLANLKSESLHR